MITPEAPIEAPSGLFRAFLLHPHTFRFMPNPRETRHHGQSLWNSYVSPAIPAAERNTDCPARRSRPGRIFPDDHHHDTGSPRSETITASGDPSHCGGLPCLPRAKNPMQRTPTGMCILFQGRGTMRVRQRNVHFSISSPCGVSSFQIGKTLPHSISCVV